MPQQIKWKSRRGEVAVITGGSNGIGAASTELFIAAGGKVVIADLDDVNGKRLANKFPGMAFFVFCDTRNRSDLEFAIDTAKKLGKFTVMFNNAGVATRYDAVEHALDNWDTLQRVIDINVNACCLGTYLALEHFSKDRVGSVITTASMAGLLPTGAPPIYSLSKAANIHFTRSIASSLDDSSNCRVYALCPSFTATAMGPNPEVIKVSLGGVLNTRHQAEGFMMLAEGNLPNGSVMRVTVRSGGKYVVHDLVAWGKELGGPLPARNGELIKKEILEEWTGPMVKVEEPLDVSKL